MYLFPNFIGVHLPTAHFTCRIGCQACLSSHLWLCASCSSKMMILKIVWYSRRNSLFVSAYGICQRLPTRDIRRKLILEKVFVDETSHRICAYSYLMNVKINTFISMIQKLSDVFVTLSVEQVLHQTYASYMTKSFAASFPTFHYTRNQVSRQKLLRR